MKYRNRYGEFTKGHKFCYGIRGKLHNNWKVNNPSYGSVHTWLLRYYKHTKTKCHKCSSKRFLEWALKKGKKHTHNINNYYILCSSCHKKYDYTEERKKKMSATMKGRKILWSEKISKSLKGRSLSEEAKKKISIFRKLNPRRRNKYGRFY